MAASVGPERQVEAGEMRVHGASGVPAWVCAVAATRSSSGCAGDEAEQLAARVPTGPRDRNPDSHTNLRMTMQKP